MADGHGHCSRRLPASMNAGRGGAGAAQIGGKASPGPDGVRATFGGARRWLERAGEATGGLQSFKGAVRAIDATTLRSEGRSMLLRLVRTGGSCWSVVLLTGAAGRTVMLVGEDDADRS